MSYTFNLIDQPWIPCMTTEGAFVEVSLYDLLANAHTLREICCETSLMTTALFPMTLALLHRIFGPSGTEDWARLWQQGAFPMQPVEAYLRQWHDRFDLFHPERPFYQAMDDRVSPKSMIHLIHSIGNTGTLFTHASDDTPLGLSPAEAARYLLTAQVFRTAGLSGLVEKFTDSPLTRGVLFWAGGSHLFECFTLNLIAYPSGFVRIKHTPNDLPTWEQEMPFAERVYPDGYMDYLTWQGNRILLIPETTNGQVVINTMTVAPGLRIAADLFSPQKRYNAKEDKEGQKSWSFMYFNPAKALWRDYHSLITLDNKEVHPPAVIEWLATLALDVFDEDTTFRLTATGMLADQAKPMFYRQEQLPLALGLLRDPDCGVQIKAAIGYADEIAKQVNNAVNILAEEVLKRGGDRKPDGDDRRNLVNQWDVLSLYWAQLETHFWDFVEDLAHNHPDAIERWNAALVDSARHALDAASRMSGTGAAALHGQVVAQRILNSGIKKVLL